MDQLIQRLKAGFQSVKGIQAFLVFGSVSKNCADAYSDLDFLIIAQEELVPDLIHDLGWLDKIEPLEIILQEGPDNFKVLFQSGQIGDFGIACLNHYQEYTHEKGKVIFCNDELDLETMNHSILPETHSDTHWLNQFMFTVYIGLGRLLRGEMVCATQMIMGDVLIAFLHLMKPKNKDYDYFQINRRYEALGLNKEFDLKEVLDSSGRSHRAAALMFRHINQNYVLDPLFKSLIEKRLMECFLKLDPHDESTINTQQ